MQKAFFRHALRLFHGVSDCSQQFVIFFVCRDLRIICLDLVCTAEEKSCLACLDHPVAIMVGNGLGARNGILFKTAASLEAAGRTQIVALDKTGTITSGEPRVTDILPAEGVSESELLTLAASLEQKSEHPLAKAVLAYAETETIACPDVTDFAALPGNGLSARLDGMEIYGGNAEFIATKASVPAELQAEAARLAAEGKTPLFFGGAGRLMGVIAVADTLKEDMSRDYPEI